MRSRPGESIKLAFERKQRARAGQRKRRHGAEPPGVLRRATVGPAMQKRYATAVALLNTFCLAWNYHLTNLDAADCALDKYFEWRYAEGDLPWVGRDAMYGLAWTRDWVIRAPDFLPLAKKSLKGWSRLSPSMSRDPVPSEALVVLCLRLLDFGKIGGRAALLLLIAFDCYLRPSEALSLTTGCISAPSSKKYNHWVITVAPLRDESSRPAKNKEFDQSVILAQFDRAWLTPLFAKLHATTLPGASLFAPLTLGKLEELCRKAARVGPFPINFFPHMVRHGGLSSDLYYKLIDLKGVRVRGRWCCMDSVRRYAKSATLLRQVKQLPGDVIKDGGRLEGNLRRRLAADLF